MPSSPRRTPSYKTPPYTRTYPGIPVAALGHPMSWIYLHWSAVSAFFIWLVVVSDGTEVCLSLRYFIYIDRTCLSFWGPCARARLSMQFSSETRVWAMNPSPTLMILSSLPEIPGVRQDSFLGLQYSPDMYHIYVNLSESKFVTLKRCKDHSNEIFIYIYI